MTTSLGLESGTVRVVAYDSSWPGLFAAEAERISRALGRELPLALEHTGSTAVPGLAAKPIIDILAGYPAVAHVDAYVEALIRAGYVHRGEQGIPGREFFRRGDPRSYHLHLALQGGEFWTDHIAFRDSLRTHPYLLAEYAELKLELANRFPRDREAYIEGKTEFVQKVLSCALP